MTFGPQRNKGLLPWAGLALAALLFVGGQRAHAQPTPLSALLQPGASLTVGDKVFVFEVYNASGDMPSAANVDILPFFDPNNGNSPGIRIFGAFFDAPGGGFSDASLIYTVTSLGAPIFDNRLFANVSVAGTGDGFISIVETVTPVGGTTVTKEAFATQFGGVENIQNEDFLTYAPTQTVRVTKDILAASLTGSAVPNASIIEQSFSQIPEPGSVALVCLSAAGLLGYGYRRRKKVV